ncbi:tetratricopeptide repeat protein [Halalkalibacter alkalisediminis]|uniref:Tetratricopeptide repeat protein n=1 Tax=Halalkalibacter alkalisediminis TaxID=935616 RepID=A0ABV6NI70_9BACI|nr:tetratricopeptide repeat protein [Halalkalibacter alkalisediminis]
MNPTEWKLSTNKGQVTIQGQKLTLFQQCKIIECCGSDDQQYLLFFYKNQFLAVQPLVKYAPKSFLGLVEKKGYHLSASHLLFSQLLPTSSTLKLTPIHQILAKIKKCRSPEETTLIFSYFDSYIPSDQLEELLKDVFFTYRRNGKLLAAFRLAKILISRGYKQNWLISTIKHPDYANVSKTYQTSLSNLLTTDPIYVEQQCFLQLPTHHNLLMTLYSEQKRPTDAIIILTNQWLQHQNDGTYSDLIQFVSTQMADREVLLFLHSLLPYATTHFGFFQDVYKRLIHKHDYKSATKLLFTYSFPLSHTETDQFSNLLEHVTLTSSDLTLEKMAKRLFPLLDKHPLIVDKFLQAALPELLNHHSLSEIHLWLQPIQTQKELPIVKKVSEMVDLMNDSDHQFNLGIHYYDLKQYEHAIDCFNWEMELNPNQIEPIQWLAKTYRKLGKLEEVETYHSLLSQIQRSS